MQDVVGEHGVPSRSSRWRKTCPIYSRFAPKCSATPPQLQKTGPIAMYEKAKGFIFNAKQIQFDTFCSPIE